MAAGIKSFWGALLSVLLKCIATLGFATRERAEVGQAVAAAELPTTATTATVARTDARPAVEPETDTGAEATARTETGVGLTPVGPSATAPTSAAPVTPATAPTPPTARTTGAAIPAPRAGESRLVRRNRGRATLPPTMKQRIGAEAHGASPSARSLRTDEGLDMFSDLGELGELAAAATGGHPGGHTDAAARTDARRRRAADAHSAGRTATRDLYARAA